MRLPRKFETAGVRNQPKKYTQCVIAVRWLMKKPEQVQAEIPLLSVIKIIIHDVTSGGYQRPSAFSAYSDHILQCYDKPRVLRLRPYRDAQVLRELVRNAGPDDDTAFQ